MKIIKSANYKKMAGSGMVPGEDLTSYYVRATQRELSKGANGDVDMAMDMAGVPENFKEMVGMMTTMDKSSGFSNQELMQQPQPQYPQQQQPGPGTPTQ